MLIIFDCDGVLVDSEQLAAEVFSGTLAQLDISMSADDCHRQFRGHSMAYCLQWLESRFKRPLPRDFETALERATRAAFASHLQPVSGVKDVLQRLDALHVPFCVASNGSHAKISHSLEITGLLPLFADRRFSAEDVERGKPAPDLYLYAAESMGVPAGFTTVVEDSEAGLNAALAAGMKPLMYIPEGGPEPDARVTMFRKMEDLPGLLGV